MGGATRPIRFLMVLRPETFIGSGFGFGPPAGWLICLRETKNVSKCLSETTLAGYCNAFLLPVLVWGENSCWEHLFWRHGERCVVGCKLKQRVNYSEYIFTSEKYDPLKRLTRARLFLVWNIFQLQLLRQLCSTFLTENWCDPVKATPKPTR